MAISDNDLGLLSAEKAKIAELEAGLITQGQGLLNLETTQQAILEKLESINIVLSRSSNFFYVPDDFVFKPFIPASYLTPAMATKGNYPTYPNASGYYGKCQAHGSHFHIGLGTKPYVSGWTFAPSDAIEYVQFLTNYQIKIRYSYYFAFSILNPLTLEQIKTLPQSVNVFNLYATTRNDALIEGSEILTGDVKSNIFNGGFQASTATTGLSRFANIVGEGHFETNNLKNTKTFYTFRGWLGNQNWNADSSVLSNNGILKDKIAISGTRIYIEIERFGEKLYEPEMATLTTGDYDLTLQQLIS